MFARRRSSALRIRTPGRDSNVSAPALPDTREIGDSGGLLVDEVAAFLESASLHSTPAAENGGAPSNLVLLPYGKCAAADHALNAVVALFGALPIRVRVLHLAQQKVHLIPHDDGAGADGESTACVETAVARLRCHGITAVGVVRSGLRRTLPDLILTEAESSGAGVIVMGARRRHGLATAVAGSTSRVVLREATCPVLMVRSP